MQYKKIKNNLIHKTAIIDWKNVYLGKNNVIEAYSVIGGPAQHPKKKVQAKLLLVTTIKLINLYVLIDQHP